MHRRLFFTVLTATVVLAALGGATDRASAAIRVTISDGTDTQVFYSPDSTSALFSTSIGDYDMVLQLTGSNYPGQPSGAFLAQTIIVSDNDPPSAGFLPTLTVLAEVINDVAGVSAGLVTGANLAAVQAASLALFTQPNTEVLRVHSDVASAEPSGLATSGVVQNITRVDGIPVASLPNQINATTEAETIAFIGNVDGVFTLTSEVILSLANEGISGLAISASSGVHGTDIPIEQLEIIPEPGSLAVLSLGAFGLVWAGRRRLLSKKS